MTIRATFCDLIPFYFCSPLFYVCSPLFWFVASVPNCDQMAVERISDVYLYGSYARYHYSTIQYSHSYNPLPTIHRAEAPKSSAHFLDR